MDTPARSPDHVAIIMDGNGRWAEARGLPRSAGHQHGFRAIEALIPAACEAGVKQLTLFAFSSENWQREAREVQSLMQLAINALADLDDEHHLLQEYRVRFRIIGRRGRFPKLLQQRIRAAEELTQHYDGLTLTLAMDYGGRWDITRAARALAREVASGRLSADDLDETHLAEQLCTGDLPEPDLFIRTGGETRISNFLLWQLAYTELLFLDVYWPDFTAKHLTEALGDFANRHRRFGGTPAIKVAS